MANLFNWFAARAEEHLSDEQIIAVIDGELVGRSSGRVHKHLETCWRCSARREQLESAIFSLIDYRQERLSPFLPPPPLGEERFLRRLEQSGELPRSRWQGIVSRFRSLTISAMTPIVSSMIVIALAGAVLAFIWKRYAPPVSANELLVRAEVWDQGSLQKNRSGVVLQEIRIQTPRRTVQRTVYRDVEGRRRLRPQKLSLDDKQLQVKLATASVSWDEPLSAANYKDWHDRQRIARDEVARIGDALLTLTTTTQDGPVAQESLTVRGVDYRAVARTVHFRDDSDTVEIAELNFAVLSWSAVNDSISEPLSPLFAAAIPEPIAILPSLPTRAELDDAELQARLVLNHVNADSTEQLEFTRSSHAVHVKGLVETNSRKNVLLAELRPIPHVTASIFSVEELNSLRNSVSSSVNSIKEYSVIAQPSPLERFLRERSRPPEELSRVSQQLLDGAVSVQQESIALGELFQSFTPESHLSSSAASAFNELVTRHSANLLAAVDSEERTIRGLQVAPVATAPLNSQADAVSVQSINVAATRNRALCRELIASGSEVPPRSAEAIASDLLVSVLELRGLASRLQVGSRLDPQGPQPSLRKPPGAQRHVPEP